jgi:hypothetical protein
MVAMAVARKAAYPTRIIAATTTFWPAVSDCEAK